MLERLQEQQKVVHGCLCANASQVKIDPSDHHPAALEEAISSFFWVAKHSSMLIISFLGKNCSYSMERQRKISGQAPSWFPCRHLHQQRNCSRALRAEGLSLQRETRHIKTQMSCSSTCRVGKHPHLPTSHVCASGCWAGEVPFAGATSPVPECHTCFPHTDLSVCLVSASLSPEEGEGWLPKALILLSFVRHQQFKQASWNQNCLRETWPVSAGPTDHKRLPTPSISGQAVLFCKYCP